MSKHDEDLGLELFKPYRHGVLFAFAFAFTLDPEYKKKEHAELIREFFSDDDEFRISTNVFAYNIHKGFTFDRECQIFLKAITSLAEHLNIRIGFGLSETADGDEFFYVSQV